MLRPFGLRPSRAGPASPMLRPFGLRPSRAGPASPMLRPFGLRPSRAGPASPMLRPFGLRPSRAGPASPMLRPFGLRPSRAGPASPMLRPFGLRPSRGEPASPMLRPFGLRPSRAEPAPPPRQIELPGPYARSGSRFRVLARDPERLVHFAERPIGVERLTLAGEVGDERVQLLLVLAAVPPEVRVRQERPEDEERPGQPLLVDRYPGDPDHQRAEHETSEGESAAGDQIAAAPQAVLLRRGLVLALGELQVARKKNGLDDVAGALPVLRILEP